MPSAPLKLWWKTNKINPNFFTRSVLFAHELYVRSLKYKHRILIRNDEEVTEQISAKNIRILILPKDIKRDLKPMKKETSLKYFN